MRFITTDEGIVEHAKRQRMEWHSWYAWRPVRAFVHGRIYSWVWLERIERRSESLSFPSWTYRTVHDPKAAEHARARANAGL